MRVQIKKGTDVRVISSAMYLLPLKLRVPLKFGAEVLREVNCCRVRVTVRDERGRTAEGWGETPLSTQWVWPSSTPLGPREGAINEFCHRLVRRWPEFDGSGHPLEVGHDFQREILRPMLTEFNQERGADAEPMPWLAALLCCSAFDVAVHDAYGVLHGCPTYATYNADHMSRDLSFFLEPASASVSFSNLFPADFLRSDPERLMPCWHVVGGLDLVRDEDRAGDEPDDGHPVTLPAWIERDGLKCLKIKLRGTDAEWDYRRVVDVGRIAIERNVLWLSPDFNCTVTDPAYVNIILDRLMVEHPRIYAMILYVEQPFPYELEEHAIDVHGVSARKPLFMDESAHDWQVVRLGRSLGWSGVALKTCKTQTGALLTLCWAKAHGMTLMVQDLTNPMLAIFPHVLLAAHGETIMGVECNAMQFYPEASRAEAEVHPDLYQRRDGSISLATVVGPGFGYQLERIKRDLPDCVAEYGG